MSFFVIGTSHTRAPIEVREKLAFTKKKAREAMDVLKKTPGIEGCLILSTCNRAEIYAWTEARPGTGDRLKDLFASFHGGSRGPLEPFLYDYKDEAAVRHLLRVACGLDSQIPGEPEILGQVKRAFCEAGERDALNGSIRQLFSEAIAAAERIRSRKDFLPSGDSLARQALEVVRSNCGDPASKKFLMIGTGKIMELFIPLLEKEKIRPVFIANRNHEKAERWARLLRGGAGFLGELGALVPEADVLISATSCPHVMVSRADLLARTKPLVIVDLAVPRDVDPEAKTLPGIRLYDLDDLRFASSGGVADAAMGEIETMVKRESEHLWNELSGSGQEKVLSR